MHIAWGGGQQEDRTVADDTPGQLQGLERDGLLALLLLWRWPAADDSVKCEFCLVIFIRAGP